MANLDSSWEASVIKLAQTGNSRAVAFWLNRYLVPQGICAQVETVPAGCLLIRVVCRQVPDSDRLVRFICHRLCKLDSDLIQQVRITAQAVGSPQIVWEKSARLIPPSERQAKSVHKVHPFPQADSPADSATNTQTAHPTHPAVGQATASQSAMPVTLIAPGTAMSQAAPGKTETGKTGTGQVAGKTAKSKSRQQRHAKSWLQISEWQLAVRQKIQTMQTSSIDLTDRSIHWFMQQKPMMRGLLLGSSAVAAFLIGCSFELVGYYVDPTAFQRSKASLTRMLRSTASGSVKIGSERIPVIHQPVVNPDDPTVSLIFGNSVTLTRLSPNQPAPTPASDGSIPLITDIENYRQADMIVTSLSSPVSPTAGSTQSVAGSEPTTRDADAADAPVTDDTLILDELPETEDEETMSDPSDGETERAKYAAEANEDGEAKDDVVRLSQKNSPLLPQELLANGVDLVNVASNAVLTGGTAQLTQTLDLLHQNGIYSTGAGKDPAAARKPQIFNVKGQRIAYLGYADSSTRAVSAATAGVNVSLNQQMEADIKAIRDQVDWIVVNMSWNRELRAYPEDWQINLAHAAIDHGADLVVGYDASVTQGAELYNGRAIVYSLGSSIDEYNDKPVGNYDTAALKVTLKEHMMELEFLPIQVKRGRAEIAKGKLKDTILQYFSQASSVFDQPLTSPASINSQLRVSLPSAPDTKMPTEPFISYPESPPGEAASSQGGEVEE